MAGAGTAPKWIESPQGFSEGSHRVVPVAIQSRDLRPHSQAASASISSRLASASARSTSAGSGAARCGAARRSRDSCRSAGRRAAARRTGTGALRTGCRARRAPRGSCRRRAARRRGDFLLRPRGTRPGRCARRCVRSTSVAIRRPPRRISSSSSSTTSRTLARSSSSRPAAGWRLPSARWMRCERLFGAVECC